MHKLFFQIPCRTVVPKLICIVIDCFVCPAQTPPSVLCHDGDGKLIAKENDCYGIDVQDGSKLTVNSGYIKGNISAIYAYEGTVTINGGKFEIQQLADGFKNPYSFVLNCYDSAFAEGKAKITVYGGEFVNFDPANSDSGEGNLLAEGCVSTANEGGTIYTVTKA